MVWWTVTESSDGGLDLMSLSFNFGQDWFVVCGVVWFVVCGVVCGLWFLSDYNTYPSLDFDFDQGVAICPVFL